MYITKEIGSSFCDVEQKNSEFFFSGRSAEEYIVRDAVKQYGISSALLPSYCCHTMIEPFTRNNISVRFFDVYYDNGLKVRLPKKRKKEAVLYLKYFGYSRIEGLDNVLEWDVTIEDLTHSWLITETSNADYSFVSYRKWTGLSGIAKAEKKDTSFVAERGKNLINVAYEGALSEAMRLKREYLIEKAGNKDTFLMLFRKSEEILEKDYVDYSPSEKSVKKLMSLNREYIKKRRRENAKLLLEGLEGLDEIRPIYSEVTENDVPLNVPVLVNDAVRDGFRNYLVDNGVYCPVHWTLSSYHKINDIDKELYRKEISLICDQRYSIEDMKYEIQIIRNFWDKYY